jgi:hypothetical protein
MSVPRRCDTRSGPHVFVTDPAYPPAIAKSVDVIASYSTTPETRILG